MNNENRSGNQVELQGVEGQEAATPASAQSGESLARLNQVWPRVLLLVLLPALLGMGGVWAAYVLPSWEERVLVALLVVIGVALMLMLDDLRRETPSQPDSVMAPMPDAASVAEQEAALVHLTGLPQFRQLADGTLFNYLQGSSIAPCRCGKFSPFHLMVNYGKGRRHSIALVSRGALAQFLSVQDTVAAGLRQAGGTV